MLPFRKSCTLEALILFWIFCFTIFSWGSPTFTKTFCLFHVMTSVYFTWWHWYFSRDDIGIFHVMTSVFLDLYAKIHWGFIMVILIRKIFVASFFNKSVGGEIFLSLLKNAFKTKTLHLFPPKNTSCYVLIVLLHYRFYMPHEQEAARLSAERLLWVSFYLKKIDCTSTNLLESTPSPLFSKCFC